MSVWHEDGKENTEELFIDSIESIRRIDFSCLEAEDVENFEFSDLQVAYEFYNFYGKVNGFGIRRHKVGRTRTVEKKILWQTFVCCRHGHRETKYLHNTDRKMDPKPLTRCGCQAQLRVHVDGVRNRWYVVLFDDEHNHELLSSKFYGMSRSHRKLGEGNVMTMTSMRKAGISTSKIYGYIASQCGGYENVGFQRKHMYNHIDKERRMLDGDAKTAIKYLEKQAKADPLLYFKHEVDEKGALLHLFWADGRSQVDYAIFGDVFTFDATYGRNKYKCPLVVFSGVNHHLQTIVFATAIISSENERTYVWLLEKLVDAMKGRSPKSVITDGDLAMKNAIRKVFPEAHHRLCGWHLLRNATSHVSKPKFT